jgi:hypothetical protein
VVDFSWKGSPHAASLHPVMFFMEQPVSSIWNAGRPETPAGYGSPRMTVRSNGSRDQKGGCCPGKTR